MFNVSEGLFNQPASWYAVLDDFFWWEVSWYCLMIFEMMLVLAVCLNKSDRKGSFLPCSAALFGLMIILICMLLLLIAETKRCCQDGSFVAEEINEEEIYEAGHRFLVSESSNSDHHDDQSLEDIDCCPEFGNRWYGGLGEIEPWTALIVLYPMRFLFASRIVALFGNIAEKDQHSAKHEYSHHVHLSIDSKKLRDVWLSAIGIHGEVAKMFGMFSGEMLQCMLGIYSKKSIDDSKELEISIRDDQTSGDSKGIEYRRSRNDVSEKGTPDHSSRQLLNRIQSFHTSSTELASKLKSSAHCTDDIVTFDDFSYPTARLICRMRRCERLLLPLLDEWLVVDAVLTSHELILFSVLYETEETSLVPDQSTSSLRDGGKGLYLCDVASGRRIVSQFNLEEMSGMDIEHRIAIDKEDISGDDVEVNHIDNLLEYWQGGDIPSKGYQVSSMNKRWVHVNEDRLKIRFKHHTLFLRFVADLKEMEQKSKVSHSCNNSSNLTAHVGAEAKVWCRTIAR